MARKVKRHKSKDPAVNEQLRKTRAVAGIERKEFFAAGGDLKQWRPPRKIAVNKKRHANKSTCRGMIKC